MSCHPLPACTLTLTRAPAPPRVRAARTACGLLVLLLRPLLRGLPRAVDALFLGAPRAELAVVMILCPLAMNLAQAWIQDAYLKAQHTHGGGGGAGGGGEGLLGLGGRRTPKAGAVPGSPFGGLEAVYEARPSQEGPGCDGDEGDEGDGAALLRSPAGGAYRGDS